MNKTRAEPSLAIKPKSRKKGWLKALLWFFITLPVLLAVLVFWLLTTESGLRFGLLKLPSWFGVQVQADDVQGTVWRGFSSAHWQVNTKSVQISSDKLLFSWAADELRQRRLHVRNLETGVIHIISKSQPPKPDKAAAVLPQSIDLPLSVVIDRVRIGGLTTGEPSQTILLPSEINYQYDTKNHRLNVVALRTPWQSLSGTLTLNTQSPFALNGNFSGNGTLLDDKPISSKLQLSGSLETPELAATLTGEHLDFQMDGRFKPFALLLNHKVIKLNVLGRNLNPQAFLPSLPSADLNLSIGVAPQTEHHDELAGIINISNAKAAAYDAPTGAHLPFQTLVGRLGIDSKGAVHIPQLEARFLQQGKLLLSGMVDTAAQNLNIKTVLQNIQSQDLLQTRLPGSLNGNIVFSGSLNNLQGEWQLNIPKADSIGVLHLLTDQHNAQRTLLLDNAEIQVKNGGKVDLQGSLALFQEQALSFTATSSGFNPNKLNSDFPAGNINGQLQLSGKLADIPDIQAALTTHNSSLSGASLNTNIAVRYQEQHISQADINLSLGQNRLISKGSFGKAADKLNLDINMPQLDLFGFGIKGLLTAKGFVAGEPKSLTANLQGQAQHLHIQKQVSIDKLDFVVQGSPDINQPLNVNVSGQAIQFSGSRVNHIKLGITGSGKQHRLTADADMQLGGKPYRADIRANGGLDKQYQWRGLVNQLDLGGSFDLKLLAPIQLEAGSKRVIMNRARWAIMGGNLNLDTLEWNAQSGINSRGNANHLALAQLHNLISLPVKQNLVLSGDWNFAYQKNMTGYLKIRQEAGDIILPQRNQALGLRNVLLDTQFRNNGIQTHLIGDTHYGNTDAQLLIKQTFGGNFAQAPVSGRIRFNAPDLSRMRYLMPVGMELKGKINIDAAVSGTLNNPQLNGGINGEELFYRERSNGVVLENGVLKSRLQGHRWVIDSFVFKRKKGDLTLRGTVNLAGSTPDVDITAHFNRYAILDQVDRRLTLSGQTHLLYSQLRGVVLNGALTVDNGQFGFPESGMPNLDNDVVVVGRETHQNTAATPISLNLVLDLNNRFRFSGEGLDVLLGGKLTAAAQPKEDIQIVGTVNIVRGQYKAYGQDLVIESGSTISFVGPASDPNLKLRATRRFSPVGAGVEALGSLNNPRISLVATEAMSDKDKLSWLILGRASGGSAGDEAALSAATSAFLAGKINDRLGLVDELGFTSQQTRNAQTGEMNPAEQVVTVGKRITNNVSIGYEYGIESATQTVKLTYQLSRAIQTIAKVGSNSVGGEVKYSIRFD
ncbi:translocation/assembly module TamB domain-containing protein [Stenoxybacter acetivorans]|uniref:translocation/assembly module TamB domain-containing protein n=1 Tax=Stenoxybacter acetivorans TaxID=422441 RepID=UPI00055D9C79|nr:translocation/assembly module TamB domain-containing protein [Stenoxybacter acetivorans]